MFPIFGIKFSGVLDLQGVKVAVFPLSLLVIVTTVLSYRAACDHTVNGNRALFHASKTAKIITVILLRAPCQNVNVLLGVTKLTIQGHVTSSVTWPFDSQLAISYRCSIIMKSLSPAVSEIMGTEHIAFTTLNFWLTWRHRSCDQLIPRRPFCSGCGH